MKQNLKVFESFSGYGSQRMALRNLGIEFESVGISEIDIPAILSYASIHDGLNQADDTFIYPSKEEMIEYLEQRNIGLDFKSKKVKLPKNLDKLKQLYRGAVLSKCFGDISLINPSDLPDIDLFTYSFPCFVEGTLVLTSNGYKPIEDITSEDYVMTHTNTYQKVVKPMVNEADHIYKLSTMASEDLFVTEEHPFYVRKMSRYYPTHENGKRGNVRKFSEPTWVKTKDLDKSYYVGQAINTKSELPKWEGITFNGAWGHETSQNEISALFNDNSFWWLVGRFIGDGWTREYKGTQGDNFKRHDERVVICCAKNELHEITNVLDELPFSYSVSEERTVYKVHIVHKEFARYLYQFGRGASNKHLTADIINLPTDLLKSFLDGYLSSDGYVNKKGYHKISSVSRQLIYDTAQCVMKVYKRPVSVYHTKRNPTCVIEGRTVNQKDTYELRWKATSDKQDKAFYEDGYIWSPINKLEKMEYNGLVYNMEVENDNSYVVQNIIVHNCTDISVAGQQQGVIKGQTRSGLLYECEKIIEVKRPKYLLMENVKNLVGKKFKEQFDEWLGYLESLGYTNYWQVLNAKDYCVPQNRERVFVVSILNDEDKDYVFPQKQLLDIRLKDVLESQVDEKYYLSEEVQARFKPNDKFKDMTINNHNVNELGYLPYSDANKKHQSNTVYDIEGVNPTLTACDYKAPTKIVESQVVCEQRTDEGLRFFKNNICGTLRTIDACGDKRIIELHNHTGNNIKDYRIRKLTPKECWRLMGCSDEDFEKAKLFNSDSQLYKQAGNSIVVNVLEGIFANMFCEKERDNGECL